MTVDEENSLASNYERSQVLSDVTKSELLDAELPEGAKVPVVLLSD